jgi:2-pyrone-4,6-dicarboxylate lactonase
VTEPERISAADGARALTLVPSDGCPPPHPNPRRPSITLPPGSCDSHCHVFGPQATFPYAKNRTFTPAEAPVEALAALHKLLGLQRAVIVQSSCYGTDHSALLDALNRSEGRYRGVALIDQRTPRSQIMSLHDSGVRGFRVHFLPHLPRSLSWDDVAATARRVAELGWHAEIHVSSDGIARFAGAISALPVPVVIDHLGRVDVAMGTTGDSFGALTRLLDSGRVWVKTSGVDRVSGEGPPYRDGVGLAADLVARAPERVLWGTDFPHTNIVGPAPDDGLLVDLLAQIAPQASMRQRLLVENPRDFFGFD